MATSIVMPQMGYDMQEGTVVRWLKHEGDEVSRGDVLAEIETDKATVEFEAYVSGVLRKIVAQEGVVIPVGELIAVIGDRDEPIPDDVADSGSQADTTSDLTASGAGGATRPAPQPAALAPAGEVRASPLARRIARERSIDLALVTGTGPGGRIVEQDVLDYREAAPSPQTAVASSTPGRVERASPIARRLARERSIDLALVTGTGPRRQGRRAGCPGIPASRIA